MAPPCTSAGAPLPDAMLTREARVEDAELELTLKRQAAQVMETDADTGDTLHMRAKLSCTMRTMLLV